MDRSFVSTPAVGVVVAMAAEERHLLAHATRIDRLRTSVFVAHRFEIEGVPVAMVRSGIGMVHAAAATEALVLEHHPSIILNFGCAGAHRADFVPGDVVIGDRVVHHFARQILPDGTSRYVGFTREDSDSIASVDEHHAIDADPRLIERAEMFARRHAIEPWPGGNARPRAYVGAVASADVWTQATAQLESLHQEHGTLCEDMEAAAVGRIAFLHELPFLTVKDIANNEFLETTDLSDFTEFPVSEVGKRAASIVAGVIADIGRNELVCC
jgi:adenosylhomocysteine nucleosidase